MGRDMHEPDKSSTKTSSSERVDDDETVIMRAGRSLVVEYDDEEEMYEDDGESVSFDNNDDAQFDENDIEDDNDELASSKKLKHSDSMVAVDMKSNSKLKSSQNVALSRGNTISQSVESANNGSSDASSKSQHHQSID